MPPGARSAQGSPIKKGDAVFVKKSGSCLWLNVLDVKDDEVVGSHINYLDNVCEQIVIEKECILDVFNEERVQQELGQAHA